MYDTSLDIEVATREAVTEILEPALSDSVELFPQIKQAYWNVKGPKCIALHELFDDIAVPVDQQLWIAEAHLQAVG
jgi:starvation-inducible DNA-binding protein